jgi:hypothetical protein
MEKDQELHGGVRLRLRAEPGRLDRYVTGYSTAWLTIGYGTADGTQVFRARYDRQANNYAYATAVSPNGSQVFVTGTSNQGPGSNDVMATAAYRTS